MQFNNIFKISQSHDHEERLKIFYNFNNYYYETYWLDIEKLDMLTVNACL